MKKTIVLIISLIIIIVCLILYLFLNLPIGQNFYKPGGLPNGIPIKANGGGGLNLYLATASSPSDKIFLKVEENTGLPINVKVENVFKSRIEKNSYWCEVYNYQIPFPLKFVEVDAVDSSDPNFNNNHAVAFLHNASPYDLNRRLPKGSEYTYEFNGEQGEKYFFFEIINQSQPIPVTISEEFDGLVPGLNSHYFIDSKILFLDVKQSTIIHYKLTNVSGLHDPIVKINVYCME